MFQWLAKEISKMAIYLLVFAILGQVPINDRTLEQRYHSWVNSESFKETFSFLSTPLKEGSEKIIKKSRDVASSLKNNSNKIKKARNFKDLKLRALNED